MMGTFEDFELELGSAVKDIEILPQHLKAQITMGACFHPGTTHFVPVCYCNGLVVALETKLFTVSVCAP